MQLLLRFNNISNFSGISEITSCRRQNFYELTSKSNIWKYSCYHKEACAVHFHCSVSLLYQITSHSPSIQLIKHKRFFLSFFFFLGGTLCNSKTSHSKSYFLQFLSLSAKMDCCQTIMYDIVSVSQPFTLVILIMLAFLKAHYKCKTIYDKPANALLITIIKVVKQIND